jgi:hypothetical protein
LERRAGDHRRLELRLTPTEHRYGTPFLFSVSSHQKREKSFSNGSLKPVTDSWLRLLRDSFIGLVLLSPNTVHESSFFVLATLVFHCLTQAKLDRGHYPEPLRRRTDPPSSLVEDPVGGEQQGRRPSKTEVGLRGRSVGGRPRPPPLSDWRAS